MVHRIPRALATEGMTGILSAHSQSPRPQLRAYAAVSSALST
jgi:hypothetical protein